MKYYRIFLATEFRNRDRQTETKSVTERQRRKKEKLPTDQFV